MKFPFKSERKLLTRNVKAIQIDYGSFDHLQSSEPIKYFRATLFNLAPPFIRDRTVNWTVAGDSLTTADVALVCSSLSSSSLDIEQKDSQRNWDNKLCICINYYWQNKLIFLLINLSGLLLRLHGATFSWSTSLDFQTRYTEEFVVTFPDLHIFQYQSPHLVYAPVAIQFTALERVVWFAFRLEMIGHYVVEYFHYLVPYNMSLSFRQFRQPFVQWILQCGADSCLPVNFRGCFVVHFVLNETFTLGAVSCCQLTLNISVWRDMGIIVSPFYRAFLCGL